MPCITPQITGNSNPLKPPVGIDGLPQPTKQQLGKFVHYITVNHQSQTSILTGSQNQDFTVLQLPFRRMQSSTQSR